MFQPLSLPVAFTTIHVDGEALAVPEGMTLAAALLGLGRGPFRLSAVSGSPRAPYCMMGACFECLVEIDGRPGQQACLAQVRPGMQVRLGTAP